MKKYKIIIDTNVLVSGLKSRLGASYKLLSSLNDERIQLFLSNSLLFEYEEILKRNNHLVNLDLNEIDSLLDDICAIASTKNIFYLWRPTTSDPDDDFIVDLAIASNIDYIITFNVSNFLNAKKMNIKTITPKEFLQLLGGIQ
ncbi:MAG TPA: putative toxin-antitoxin system toxin component, PIN family [Leptospiraceae bacterium]|nr:putative toxin-antitoxin system toxin component, PIN family [Leptospiraceae bacterium]HMX33738.1 putative toxin-antitoxin system toxin component, PIN family [Leptospiraceae bacterium]HMY33213.1 putative toxin-antitoxin system toxin component, PIN family [Leptospiraceae bacterium]HMZ65083.1 putative toxin-antitoxin system toxin component, PIN family [Leptospiraceae bacterium]HNA08769.1 putative toxin-antitoxin system toxin component, PIN family [Leptospiraceae bacterium]